MKYFTLLLITLICNYSFSQNLSSKSEAELNSMKIEAVTNENYDLAAKIKKEIETRNANKYLEQNLRGELKTAIENENFEEAATLKKKLKYFDTIKQIDIDIEQAIKSENYEKVVELKKEKQNTYDLINGKTKLKIEKIDNSSILLFTTKKPITLIIGDDFYSLNKKKPLVLTNVPSNMYPIKLTTNLLKKEANYSLKVGVNKTIHIEKIGNYYHVCDTIFKPTTENKQIDFQYRQAEKIKTKEKSNTENYPTLYTGFPNPNLIGSGVGYFLFKLGLHAPFVKKNLLMNYAVTFGEAGYNTSLGMLSVGFGGKIHTNYFSPYSIINLNLGFVNTTEYSAFAGSTIDFGADIFFKKKGTFTVGMYGEANIALPSFGIGGTIGLTMRLY